jgi:hypothetical protein
VRIAAVIGLVALLAGCGGGSDVHVTNLPAACAGDFGALVKALGAAPGPVRVDGEPISHCFTLSEDATDLQALGTSLLTAAQELGDKARAGDQKAALELGYLVGAVQKGAKRNGLGDEIVRRLEAETTIGAARKAAYDRGLRAGSSAG